MKDLPLISCLCVTHQDRSEFLKKSIACFFGQTYPNKELVIVYKGNNLLLENDLPQHGLEKISVVTIHPDSPISLGERRNISIEKCNGKYFCQWDDDDWHHNRRLEMQMNSLLASGKDASVLNRWILYDSIRNQGYLSIKRFWEGSLLCKTEIFSDVLKYPSVDKGEDNDFVVKLVKGNYVHALLAPHLYTYVYHGGNTSDSDHFQQLFKAGYKLTQHSSALIKKILEGKYSYEKASELLEDENFLNVIDKS